jgi:hypothetical protein
VIVLPTGLEVGCRMPDVILDPEHTLAAIPLGAVNLA